MNLGPVTCLAWALGSPSVKWDNGTIPILVGTDALTVCLAFIVPRQSSATLQLPRTFSPPSHSQPTSAWDFMAPGVVFIQEALPQLPCPLCGRVLMCVLHILPEPSCGTEPCLPSTIITCLKHSLSFPSHFSTSLLLFPGVTSQISSLDPNLCLKAYFEKSPN